MRYSDTSPRWSRQPLASITESPDELRCLCHCCACGGVMVIAALLFLLSRACIDCGGNLDLFVDSIAVSSSSSSATAPAEWYVRFLVKRPLTGVPDFSLNMLYGRLLRREKSLSTVAMDNFRGWEFVDEKPVATTEFFNTTAVEALGDEGTVVWDFRVEVVAFLTKTWRKSSGAYLIARCNELPVRFWSDPAAPAVIKGSLLGEKKQCDCSFQEALKPWDYPLSDASSKVFH